MYRKVLVPLDGTEISEHSISHVKSIATSCNVPQVILLRIVEPMPVYAELGEAKRVEINKNAEVGAKEYLARIAGILKKENINTESVMIVGEDAATEILNYAQKSKVDLIIMTSHSHSGLMRWLIGSVAERVIRHSPVSILLVSPEK